MAKKEWREVPVEELTEEEVRRWFVRLRELYREERHRVHNLKVERWQLRVEVTKLKHENAILRKGSRKVTVSWWVKKEVSDFKKKFFDSL